MINALLLVFGLVELIIRMVIVVALAVSFIGIVVIILMEGEFELLFEPILLRLLKERLA